MRHVRLVLKYEPRSVINIYLLVHLKRSLCTIKSARFEQVQYFLRNTTLIHDFPITIVIQHVNESKFVIGEWTFVATKQSFPVAGISAIEDDENALNFEFFMM
jgi:hypothetical protein